MREASISQCYESTISKVKMPQKLKLLGEDTRIILYYISNTPTQAIVHWA